MLLIFSDLIKRLVFLSQETRKAIASLKDSALEEATMAELEFKSESIAKTLFK